MVLYADISQYDAALIYDGVRVIKKAFLRLLSEYPNLLKGNFRRGEVYNNGTRGIADCDNDKATPWENGEIILDYIRKVLVKFYPDQKAQNL